MKYFNNFTQLSQAILADNTPVTVLKPAMLTGIVQSTGDGLTLPNGKVLVMKFDDIEAITKRRTQILADEFLGNLSARLNTYSKDTEGEWVASADGLTSTVFYAGSLWWPQNEEEYSQVDHQIISWSNPSSDTLEVRTLNDRYFVFEKFIGLGQTPIDPAMIDADSLVVDDGETSDTLSNRFSRIRESDKHFMETNGVNLQDLATNLEIRKWVINSSNGSPEVDNSGLHPVLRLGRSYWNPGVSDSDLVFKVVTWNITGNDLAITATDTNTGDNYTLTYTRRIDIGLEDITTDNGFIVVTP